MAEHLVVMGVSGAGKSTVARRLAALLDRAFAEADEFHSLQNVAKMSSGGSLSSSDREPWLDSIRDWMDERAAEGESTVVACSALRRAYRDRLRTAQGGVLFLHLVGTPELIRARMAARQDHFMPVSLIDSQFADLEPLSPAEDGGVVFVDQPVDVVVSTAVELLGRRQAAAGRGSSHTV